MSARIQSLYGAGGECRLCGTRETHPDDSTCAGLLLEKIRFSMTGTGFWEEDGDPHALVQAYAESKLETEAEEGPGSVEAPRVRLTLELDALPGLAAALGVDRLEERVDRAARDWSEVAREVETYERGREAEEVRLNGILKTARAELASLQGDYASLQRLREKTPGIFETAAAAREADELNLRTVEVGRFIQRLEQHLEGWSAKSLQVLEGIRTQGRNRARDVQANFTKGGRS